MVEWWGLLVSVRLLFIIFISCMTTSLNYNKKIKKMSSALLLSWLNPHHCLVSPADGLIHPPLKLQACWRSCRLLQTSSPSVCFCLHHLCYLCLWICSLMFHRLLGTGNKTRGWGFVREPPPGSSPADQQGAAQHRLHHSSSLSSSLQMIC